MRRNWSRSMMFSYFPIFLLTVSILIFLSFLIVGELSRSETNKANRISTGYVVDSVQNALSDVELSVLQEMETNHDYGDFLSGLSDQGDRTRLYNTVNDMRGMLYRNQLIDSIYIYRKWDDKVLTLNGLVDRDVFADRDYLAGVLAENEERNWSDVRTLRLFSSDQTVRVISMGKMLPLPFGAEGVVVVNLSMYRLERMIDDMTKSQVSFMRVLGDQGDLVYAAHQENDIPEGDVLTRITLDNTGWTFESGIRAGELFAWMSVVSYLWIIIGILTVVLGTLYILYITRKNYRPIQAMMNRIQALQFREESLDNTSRSELVLIDRALETLINQTVSYQKQYDENLLVQRRQLFLDLMEGEQGTSSLEEKLQHFKPFTDEAVQFAFIAAEMNQYEEFRRKYPAKEQNMLKLTLMNLFQELAVEEQLQGWAEWVSGNRIGLMIGSGGDLRTGKDRLRILAERYLRWVSDNLGLSLAIGVGPVVDGLEAILDSCTAAEAALQHKLSLGRDMIVLSDSLPDRSTLHSYKYLQMLSEIVREFRIADENWRQRVDELFRWFSSDQIKDEEIHMLLHMLIQMLDRELGQLSDSLRRMFAEPSLQGYYSEMESQTTLEQVHAVILKWLAEIYRIYVSVNESKSYRAMISEMKVYIEENFDNPDLSLKHLSDRFQISGKYASHLFKEEFDMKFVDFLTQLRMQRAEYLLATTSDNLQDIALKLGYTSSITFGRVFKRVVGVTPGDYRKHRMKPGTDEHEN
ncbi:HTH-type transcriptional activator RhaR [Paenibacillus auburnensis]|uniref:HTH-type transcriptional activator RhaR n=1 Tax=Paenibacillus auburnensis TaxID=2905649 RepID=A0ABM9CB29_9BACL|nr:helix-turn-helix domain-containing protein [Paenibacillus auburnensis]CAH1207458.1 HTH-type transcriptional activator RhaR [Paenibacillus auburnensis]